MSIGQDAFAAPPGLHILDRGVKLAVSVGPGATPGSSRFDGDQSITAVIWLGGGLLLAETPTAARPVHACCAG